MDTEPIQINQDLVKQLERDSSILSYLKKISYLNYQKISNAKRTKA